MEEQDHAIAKQFRCTGLNMYGSLPAWPGLHTFHPSLSLTSAPHEGGGSAWWTQTWWIQDCGQGSQDPHETKVNPGRELQVGPALSECAQMPLWM